MGAKSGVHLSYTTCLYFGSMLESILNDSSLQLPSIYRDFLKEISEEIGAGINDEEGLPVTPKLA